MLKGHLEDPNPFIDEGLLRVGGRLKHAPINATVRHQLNLPAKHYLTILLIRHEHEQYAYAGAEFSLAEIRHRYWMCKADQLLERWYITAWIEKKGERSQQFPSWLLYLNSE